VGSFKEAVLQVDRSRFDHVGVPTSEPKDGERWVEATRCWVTSPRAHPYNVEWLRYEPDSPVQGALRSEPHVAYRVDDVHAAVQRHAVVAEPFDVGDGFVTVGFVQADGAIVEFMQYANPEEEGWF
jgi:catechol 2,3-dioxygenase-like lactoylglutathione lyase family enzyme